MQKITIVTISGLIAMTLATPLGGALHEACMGDVTEITAGSSTLYIDARSGSAMKDLWFYRESGDQEGLQTGGWFDPFPDKEPEPLYWDLCDHESNRDILLV